MQFVCVEQHRDSHLNHFLRQIRRVYDAQQRAVGGALEQQLSSARKHVDRSLEGGWQGAGDVTRGDAAGCIEEDDDSSEEMFALRRVARHIFHARLHGSSRNWKQRNSSQVSGNASRNSLRAYWRMAQASAVLQKV